MHRPTHDAVRVRTVVDYHDLPEIFHNAWDALQKAREYFVASSDCAAMETAPADSQPHGDNPACCKAKSKLEDVQESKSEQSTDRGTSAHDSSNVKNSKVPRCHLCSELVKMPCWYCTQCPGESITSFVVKPSER